MADGKRVMFSSFEGEQQQKITPKRDFSGLRRFIQCIKHAFEDDQVIRQQFYSLYIFKFFFRKVFTGIWDPWAKCRIDFSRGVK